MEKVRPWCGQPSDRGRLKNRNRNRNLHLAPPVEFHGDLWHQKTRVFGVSCGAVCVILRLAVLVEHRLVTDRQMDRRTDRHRAMDSTMDA